MLKNDFVFIVFSGYITVDFQETDSKIGCPYRCQIGNEVSRESQRLIYEVWVILCGTENSQWLSTLVLAATEGLNTPKTSCIKLSLCQNHLLKTS